jgi:hypothetical protein
MGRYQCCYRRLQTELIAIISRIGLDLVKSGRVRQEVCIFIDLSREGGGGVVGVEVAIHSSGARFC